MTRIFFLPYFNPLSGSKKKEKQQTKTTNQKQTNGGKNQCQKSLVEKLIFIFQQKKNESKTNQIQL